MDQDAIELYELSFKNKQELDLYVIRKLFFFLVNKNHCFHAYQLLRHYRTRISKTKDNSTTASSSSNSISTSSNNVVSQNNFDDVDRVVTTMYLALCHGLKDVGPKKAIHRDIKLLFRNVTREIDELDAEYRKNRKEDVNNSCQGPSIIKQKCLPILISSLAQQKSVRIGRWAYRWYQELMKDREYYQLKPTYFVHLLASCRYNRRYDLPYHEILQHIAEIEYLPYSGIVVNALETLYPFNSFHNDSWNIDKNPSHNNILATKIILQSIIKMEKLRQQQEKKEEEETNEILLSKETAELSPSLTSTNISVIDNNDFDDGWGYDSDEDDNSSESEKQQQQQTSKNINKRRINEIDPYKIDIATLECIGNAAFTESYNCSHTYKNRKISRNHGSEIILSIWDYIDLMDNFEASESIYESSILTFATNEETLYDSFLIMRDMEEIKGYVPSTALIETFARVLGRDQSLFMQAEKIILGNLFDTPEIINNIIDEEQRLPLSLSSINVILAVYGERGYDNKANRVLHQLKNKGLKANVDSIRFSLESIGRCLFRINKQSSQSLRGSSNISDSMSSPNFKIDRERCARFTENLLSALEELKIQPTSTIIHYYVEILCNLGHTETATLVVLDALKKNPEYGSNEINGNTKEKEIQPIERKRRNLVENKTLYRVATATASDLRDYELASYFASQTSESLPFMQRRIDEIKANQLAQDIR